MMINNPLLIDSPLEYGAPLFNEIREEHFLPAFQEAIRQAENEIDTIVENADEPDFENTIAALDRAGRLVDRVAGIFYNINSACTSDGIKEIARKVSPMMTAYALYISLNEKLFEKVDKVYGDRDKLSLTPEQSMLLKKTHESFVRGGAALSPEDKKKYGELSEALDLAKLRFEKNLLDATNDYVLHVKEESRLKGLPSYVIEAAAEEARGRGLDGWAFTLSHTSMGSFLRFADDRELRKEIWMASATKALGGRFDNCKVLNEIVSLKSGIARLLGYETYADYVLVERMAKDRSTVDAFLSGLADKTLPYARRDVDMVAEYAVSQGFVEELMPWDFSYWAEKCRETEFSLKEEQLKPYFRLEAVVDAVFGLAGKLYGISFEQRDDLPAYHPDVKVYDVKDADGKHLSLLYMDFFPRDNKNSGAWMNPFIGQYVSEGEDHRPLISVVTNFTKPTATKPSLLTHSEVTTLLHEFGHALHETFSQCNYASLSGTNVPWDFVEFPSQIMENWAFEPEYLASFAKHYETGEPIPEELVGKLVKARNYLSGYAQLRQLQFGILDMKWYSSVHSTIEDVPSFEKRILSPVSVLPMIDGTAVSPSFSHIFDGGYSAGYYSYKWAEVLEADAYSLFEERGVFDKGTASSLREKILSKGGTEDASAMYRDFRGRDPEPDALLKKSGMI